MRPAISICIDNLVIEVVTCVVEVMSEAVGVQSVAQCWSRNGHAVSVETDCCVGGVTISIMISLG